MFVSLWQNWECRAVEKERREANRVTSLTRIKCIPSKMFERKFSFSFVMLRKKVCPKEQSLWFHDTFDGNCYFKETDFQQAAKSTEDLKEGGRNKRMTWRPAGETGSHSAACRGTFGDKLQQPATSSTSHRYGENQWVCHKWSSQRNILHFSEFLLLRKKPEIFHLPVYGNLTGIHEKQKGKAKNNFSPIGMRKGSKSPDRKTFLFISEWKKSSFCSFSN